MRLIDADELKKKVYMEEDPYGYTKMVVLETDVDEAPTIDVVPVRHGHWKVWFENEETRMLKCSECRMMFTVGKGRDGNYCPNCGARMDGGEK